MKILKYVVLNDINILYKMEEGIKLVDLYSYWITIQFIIYKLFENKVFNWMSPYPATLIGFIVQLYIFYKGRKTLKWSFIAAVFVWKLLMLIYTKYNMKYETILANMLLFCVYLLFIYIRGVDIVKLYSKSIYETEKSKRTLIEFIIFRFKNIY
jgi:hypothetical protein